MHYLVWSWHTDCQQQSKIRPITCPCVCVCCDSKKSLPIHHVFIPLTSSLNDSGFTLTHLLPEIVPCGTEVGKLAFDWEGVPAGARVFVALGDLQCSVYPFLEHQRTLNGIGGK